MRQLVVLLLGGLLISGCFVVRRDFVPSNPMFYQGSGWYNDDNFGSNGEQIYFTAVNDRGQRISYSGGQNFGGMMMGMGNNLACASCHGTDGRGGIHTMHIDVMDAPDIRYSALSGEGDDHGGDEPHGDEHGGYDLNAFRLAVIGGIHPDGEPLSRDMPRWQMSDEDLVDLFEFLKTLP
jgi:hypothetical protein